jgi:hypothetical protein
MEDKKEYSVAIHLITPSIINSPQVLSERLGLPPSLFEPRDLSHRLKKKMGARVETEWLLESELERNASLDEHIDDIISMIPPGLNIRSNNQVKSTYLNIGVFFDSRIIAVPIIRFSGEGIKFFQDTFPHFTVEIDHYPCHEDEEW